MSTEGNQAKKPVRFGKYALIERLAENSSVEVFLARQAGLEGFEKTIVIKRVRPQLSHQKAFVKSFLDQANLAAQLHHPHIVQIYDLGKIGDSYFAATEYVFGRDMRHILPRTDALGVSLPMVYALKIASLVCEGLHYAHQRTDIYGNALNITHRSISPKNILVSFDGTVKILGFGFSQALCLQPDKQAVDQARVGQLVSTLSYLAPEQCTGSTVDHRADIFSLGAVLYEWLTGYKLFTGESAADIARAITEGKITAPSRLKSDLPEAVEQMVMKALQVNREQRYSSAWEMKGDLDRFLSQYEFTPSHIHLANFLKQLFTEELEEEKKRLNNNDLREEESFAVQSEPIPLRPKTQEKAEPVESVADKVLTVSVDEKTYETLKNIAERNQVPVGTLLRDVLAGYVKYK